MHGLMDLHSHTTRCCHATGAMAAYAQRALDLGLTDFGFSDHSHWMLRSAGKRYAMLAHELELYVADVKRLQVEFNREGPSPFHIRLGMEMDFIPSRIGLAREIQERYDWDYIIGSVHNIGFEKLQEPEMYDNWSIDDVCELYFRHLLPPDFYGGSTPLTRALLRHRRASRPPQENGASTAWRTDALYRATHPGTPEGGHGR